MRISYSEEVPSFERYLQASCDCASQVRITFPDRQDWDNHYITSRKALHSIILSVLFSVCQSYSYSGPLAYSSLPRSANKQMSHNFILLASRRFNTMHLHWAIYRDFLGLPCTNYFKNIWIVNLTEVNLTTKQKLFSSSSYLFIYSHIDYDATLLTMLIIKLWIAMYLWIICRYKNTKV